MKLRIFCGALMSHSSRDRQSALLPSCWNIILSSFYGTTCWNIIPSKFSPDHLLALGVGRRSRRTAKQTT
jgi:hypothetical protein